MIDALRVFVPYSQTLFTDMSLDACLKGHESGSRHAWAYVGKIGAPRRGPTTGRMANSWSPTSTSRMPQWSGTRTIW